MEYCVNWHGILTNEDIIYVSIVIQDMCSLMNEAIERFMRYVFIYMEY